MNNQYKRLTEIMTHGQGFKNRYEILNRSPPVSSKTTKISMGSKTGPHRFSSSFPIHAHGRERIKHTSRSYWTSSSRSILEEQPEKNEVHVLINTLVVLSCIHAAEERHIEDKDLHGRGWT
jgi:hypothetical protein